MAHVNTPLVIDNLTKKRLSELASTEMNGLKVIEQFGWFIDTHRDQPHVGVFNPDIHRGMCRPTEVHYIIGEDALISSETGVILARHEKFMFVTAEFFAEFLTTWFLENGSDPRDGEGILPTSHFRDARAKVYYLKSFREMVRLRAKKEGIA